MSNRQSILAIMRWKHSEQGFQLSWPLLHVCSYWARAIVVFMMVCGSVGFLLLLYSKDVSILEALERLKSLSPSRPLLFVMALPWVILVLDFVCRYRLHITAEDVVLRRPWGTTRTWPRSTLVGAQFEIHVPDPAEPIRSKVAIVQLIFRSDSGSERVGVGGSMFPGVARRLADQLGYYTPIRHF